MSRIHEKLLKLSQPQVNSRLFKIKRPAKNANFFGLDAKLRVLWTNGSVDIAFTRSGEPRRLSTEHIHAFGGCTISLPAIPGARLQHLLEIVPHLFYCKTHFYHFTVTFTSESVESTHTRIYCAWSHIN